MCEDVPLERIYAQIFAAKGRSYLVRFLSAPTNKTTRDEVSAPAANQGIKILVPICCTLPKMCLTMLASSKGNKQTKEEHPRPATISMASSRHVPEQ